MPDLEKMARNAIASKSTREVEVQNAAGRWFKMRVRPYLTAEGEPEGAVIAFMDTHVAKRVMFQLQDAMVRPAIIADASLRILSGNRAFHSFFKTSPSKVEGTELCSLAGGNWAAPQLVKLLKRCLSDGTPVPETEVSFQLSVSEVRTLVLNAYLMPRENYAPPTLLILLEDVTARRSADLARLARENEQSQREFLHNVSHEFRTPVTAIKGCAQALLRGALADGLRSREFVGIIERHADRLGVMIEELLAVSRLAERSKLSRKRFALAGFVRSCIQDLSPLAKKQNVEIRAMIPAGIRIAADPAQLLHVLQNLLNNAIKFSRPGNWVLVEARQVEKEILVTVKDSGVGIPARDLPRLFQRFFCGFRPGPRHGAGLGLSIARQIVLAHDGRIWAESGGRGKGSAFHFTLPVSHP